MIIKEKKNLFYLKNKIIESKLIILIISRQFF
jgi:hypothetical protein